jgi:hypothetical protein
MSEMKCSQLINKGGKKKNDMGFNIKIGSLDKNL